MKRILYMVAGGIAAVAIVAMLVTASIWPVLNEVETGATAQYADIQPHYYSTQPGPIYDEALAAIEEMEQWQRVDTHRSSFRIEAERTGPLFGFVDEVTIRVEPVTEFVSRVHVRSRTNYGHADFGQNARNIRQFLVEMDHRLESVRFDPEAGDQDDESDEQVEGSEPKGPETS